MGVGEVEVIVVDNGSSDGTVAAARAFRGGLNVTVIDRPFVSVGAVRNAGAKVARGEVLAFLDADCVAPPGWLPQAIVCAKRLGGVVGGPYGVPAAYSWVAQVWAWHEARKYCGPKSFVHGANLIIARAGFATVGGFDETITSNEDYEFCQRARDCGMAVTAIPELTVLHLGTAQALNVFFRRERWHGKHVLKVFLRDFPKLRNLRAVLFASYMLVAVASSIAGAILLVTSGSIGILCASIIAATAAPMALGVKEAASRQYWKHAAPLGYLFLIYGVARALCWFDFWRSSAPRVVRR